MLETAAIFIVLGLYINQFDRNVEIKSSAGSSPSSLVHFKHSQDWVIRGYTHIEFVARIRTGNPFRCAVTDHSYSALWKAFRATEPHISSPKDFFRWALNLATSYDWCVFTGGRKVKAQQLPPAHYKGRRAQSKSKPTSTRALKNDTFHHSPLKILWRISNPNLLLVIFGKLRV